MAIEQTPRLPFTEEEFENASDDAEFEFDLGEDTSEPDEIPRKAEPAPEPDDEPEDDEGEAEEEDDESDSVEGGVEDETLSDEERQNYGKRAQKRIQQLVAQKKEADEKFRELQKQVQELQSTQATYETRARQTDEQLLTDYIQRNEQAAETAKLKLRRAKEDGDIDAELAASEELASVKAEGLLLAQYKRQYDTGQTSDGARDISPAQTQVDPAVVATERKKAYEWMRKNPWFRRGSSDVDRDMTMAAEQIHHTLIAEGYRPMKDPDAYYSELDARLAQEFPDGPPKATNSGDRKVTQKVGGGGTRSATSSKAIKSGKARITLTKSEIETARRLNVPLQEYAKQKHKRDQARQ